MLEFYVCHTYLELNYKARLYVRGQDANFISCLPYVAAVLWQVIFSFPTVSLLKSTCLILFSSVWTRFPLPITVSVQMHPCLCYYTSYVCRCIPACLLHCPKRCTPLYYITCISAHYTASLCASHTIIYSLHRCISCL
jgi:hypothetical protein